MTQAHYDRFMKLVAKRGWGPEYLNRMGGDYRAAFYLMSCSASIFERVESCVGKTGINFDKILQMDAYSFDLDSHKELMRLAANLFRSTPIKGLDCSAFGQTTVGYAVTAILIRSDDTQQHIKVDV